MSSREVILSMVLVDNSDTIVGEHRQAVIDAVNDSISGQLRYNCEFWTALMLMSDADPGPPVFAPLGKLPEINDKCFMPMAERPFRRKVIEMLLHGELQAEQCKRAGSKVQVWYFIFGNGEDNTGTEIGDVRLALQPILSMQARVVVGHGAGSLFRETYLSMGLHQNFITDVLEKKPVAC